MAETQTFDQWLKAQSNLTDAQRQALEAHNADATVTFTPESFDRYLAELRGQTPEGRGSKANADNNSENLQAALALANSDLSKMDYSQISATWNILSSVDEKAAPELLAKANEAKAKMAEFSEHLIAGVNPQQPWTMDTAPEYTSWLEINKVAVARSNDANKKARNEKIQGSLVAFYQKFDQENGLTDLNGESAQKLAENEAAITAIGKDFDPFAKDEQGKLVHPEFASIDKFYDKLDIDNSNKDIDAVNKDSLKKDMAELAYNEAVLRLSMNSDFARLDKAQQEQLLAEAYATNMQAGMISMIAAQMAEAAAKNDKNEHSIKEFEDQAAQYFTKMVNAENTSFKVSNAAALSNLAVRTTHHAHVCKRVAQKTGRKSFWQKIKDFDKRMTEKHPKAYPMLKNMAVSLSVGYATGGVGLMVLSAYKTAKAVHKSVQNYKEANKDGQYKSYFGYLKKNPKEIISLGVSVGGAALSAALVGMDGIDAADFGMSGQVYENGLSSTWETMKQNVSNAFTSSEAAKDIPWTEKAASWGRGVVEKVNPMNWDITRWSRMGISLGGGISTGAVDYVASFKEKDPEKRKQLRRNAWKAATGAFIGSAIGLTAAGVMGAHTHEDAVDGHTGASGSPHGAGSHDTENQQQNQGAAEAEAAPDKNMEFWKNRADKFLGEENVKHIYKMVESGDFKLPEGIESKEEYAYKLAMDIQQTPAEINQALGGEWKSSAKLTDSIKSWTADDFAKLNDSVDDFSDRGYHNGEIPGRSHVRAGGGHTASPTPKVQEEVVIATGTGDDKTPTSEPENNNDNENTPVAEDIRDEAYYRQEQDALKAQGDDKSLQDKLVASKKDETITLTETVEKHIDEKVETGDLTQTQGNETENLVKYKLDQNDNKEHTADGKIDEESLGKKEIKHAMKEVKQVQKSLEQNADEVRVAENLQGGFEHTENYSDTYTSDTHSSKFYEGNAKLAHDMRTSDEPIQDTMKKAILSGEVSKEQVVAFEQRYHELEGQGYNPDNALRRMEKDYNNMAENYRAQEMAPTAEWGRANTSDANNDVKSHTGENTANTVVAKPAVNAPEVDGKEAYEEGLKNAAAQPEKDEAKASEPAQTTPSIETADVNAYTVGRGSYSFDQEGGMQWENVPGDYKALAEFRTQIPRYVDNQGQYYLNQEACGFDRQDVQDKLQELAINETIYKDLQQRVSNGENIPSAGKDFITEHDKHLKTLGVTHDKNGNIVKYSETAQRSDAAMGRIKNHGTTPEASAPEVDKQQSTSGKVNPALVNSGNSR